MSWGEEDFEDNIDIVFFFILIWIDFTRIRSFDKQINGSFIPSRPKVLARSGIVFPIGSQRVESFSECLILRYADTVAGRHSIGVGSGSVVTVMKVVVDVTIKKDRRWERALKHREEGVRTT